MGLFLARRVNDLLRSQADALVHHLHSGIASTHGDLFGPIGVAIEAWFPDEESEATAQLAGDAIYIRPNVVEAGDVVAHRAADTGRCAIFAESLAKGPAPFTGGDARFGTGDQAGMILPLPRAARFNSFKASATAALSRDARHVFSRSIWLRSASSDTVRIDSAVPASGEVSLSRYLLTPTTTCSPRSIASRRAVFDSTNCCFR